MWDLSLHILLMGVKFFLDLSLRSLTAVVLSGEKSPPSFFFPQRQSNSDKEMINIGCGQLSRQQMLLENIIVLLIYTFFKDGKRNYKKAFEEE